MKSLSGKNALVTGGARGIGAAIVRRLAGEGARIVFSYKSDTAAAEALTRALETQAPGCNGLQDAFAARARIALRLGPEKQDAARSDLQRCVELSGKTITGKECSSMLQKFK